ncbi:hypothetical protein D3C84_806320 [compost metagenome]
MQGQKLILLHRSFAIYFGQRVRLQYHRTALTFPQQGFFCITIGIAELDGNQVQQSRGLAIAEGLYRRDYTAAVTHSC